jgi:hypothetical protein
MPFMQMGLDGYTPMTAAQLKGLNDAPLKSREKTLESQQNNADDATQLMMVREELARRGLPHGTSAPWSPPMYTTMPKSIPAPVIPVTTTSTTGTDWIAEQRKKRDKEYAEQMAAEERARIAQKVAAAMVTAARNVVVARVAIQPAPKVRVLTRK